LLDTPTGHAVLACAAEFAGRAPSARSLKARAGGRLTDATAAFWAGRWRDCLAPPPDARLRAGRLARDLDRFPALRADIAFVDDQLERLLAASPGLILTTLPGLGTVRAAAFAAHTLPIERFPTPEHLYSATGLAPASYESASIRRRGRIARTGRPEHRDALMGIAWGLGQFAPAFQRRRAELNARARPASRRASPWPATHAGCAGESCTPKSPTTAQLSLPPARARRSSRRTQKPAATTAPDQPADPTRHPHRRATTPIAANNAITDRGAGPCDDRSLDSPPES
jgi:Transposase IS116/IS110/IS902 family